MRTKGTAAELEARRRLAVDLLGNGMTLEETARMVHASVSSVKRWKRAWRESGEEGLLSKPHPGPSPRLSESDRGKLVQLLAQGGKANGFSSDAWTCCRVAVLIRREFEVDYHPSHVWKILRGLNWSVQKPTLRARERDQAAIDRWREEDWPRIKKGIPTAS